MTITRYNVGAFEIGGVELGGPTEVPLDSSNVYFPTTSYLAADNAQDAITAAAQTHYTYATQTNSRTTSSTSFVNDSTLSTGVTPLAGTYLVIYSADAEANNSLFEAALGEISIYSGGSLVAASSRAIGGAGANPRAGIHSSIIITVNGSTQIQPRFRCVSGTSLQLRASTFSILRLGFT